LAVKNAETRMSGSFERVDNERGLTVLAERADPLLVAPRNASRGLVGDFGREIGELADEIRCHILGANCQNDRVGGETIERTVSVDDILHVGIEVANVDFEIDAVRESLGTQQGYDGLDREGAENG